MPSCSPVSLSGTSPLYRINSSYCVFTSGGKPYLFVFGGYDNTNENFDDKVYILDIQGKSWLAPRSSGIFRNGCACVSLEDGSGNIVIVGGLLQEDECSECLERNGQVKSQFQDTFLLLYDVERDIFSLEWNLKFKNNLSDSDDAGLMYNDDNEPLDSNDSNGASPNNSLSNWIQMNRLERHSICLSKNPELGDVTSPADHNSEKERGKKLFISGGVISDLPFGMQKYLYVLDYDHFAIEKIEFCKRIEHEIIHLDNKIWSFGGMNETMKNSFLNFHTLDLSDSTVNELSMNITNKEIASQPFKQKQERLVNILTSKKYFYNQISDHQILITDLLNFQFFVLVTTDLKIHKLPIKLEPLNWLFVFSWNKELLIVGGDNTAMLENADEIPFLNCLVSYSFQNFEIFDGDDKVGENSKLLNEIEAAYHSERFVDFQIKSNDGKIIHVHKLYLLLKWPFFQNMIMSGMLESQVNEMAIDEPYEYIKLMIDYFYTRSFPVLKPDELLNFAHLIELYDLCDLKELIINRILRSKMSIDHLIEHWQLSKILRSSKLQQYLESLIYRYWGYVVKLPSFLNLNKEMMVELFSNLDLDSQIVSSSNLKLHARYPKAIQSDNDGTDSRILLTPETEQTSVFDVFKSPGNSDFWTPFEQPLLENSSSYLMDD